MNELHRPLLAPAVWSLNEENRGGYVVSAAMKQVWAVQLDLLQEFQRVCGEEGLRWWVSDGTMLGAVRHGGYIPWDDDIDVCMPRGDYDRLLQLGSEKFRSPYFFQTARTDEDYPRIHAQLRRDGTAAIRPSEAYRRFHQGVFIDIFVLDGVPEEAALRRKEMKEVHRITHLLKAARLDIVYSGRFGQVFRKFRARRMVRKYGFANYLSQVDRLFRSHPLTSCRHCQQRGCRGDFLYDPSWFDKVVMFPFEFLEVPVPKGYAQYLATQYGSDWQTPRPVSNRHGQLVFDVRRDYREVAPEVVKAYRKQRKARLLKKLRALLPTQ